MAKKPKYDPPKSSGSDEAHCVARGLIGGVPFVGAAGVEIFSRVIAPPLEQRRDAWMTRVGDSLERLEKLKVCRLQDLASNPVFIDVVMKASHAAIRNSEAEKLEALRNAVLNAALPSPPEASLQQMFVSWVDEFTVWHLRILQFFREGESWFEQRGIEVNGNLFTDELKQPLNKAYPELARKGYDTDYASLFSDDLHRRGLMDHNLDYMWSRGSSPLSYLGNAFLDFIADPFPRIDPTAENSGQDRGQPTSAPPADRAE